MQLGSPSFALSSPVAVFFLTVMFACDVLVLSPEFLGPTRSAFSCGHEDTGHGDVHRLSLSERFIGLGLAGSSPGGWSFKAASGACFPTPVVERNGMTVAEGMIRLVRLNLAHAPFPLRC